MFNNDLTPNATLVRSTNFIPVFYGQGMFSGLERGEPKPLPKGYRLHVNRPEQYVVEGWLKREIKSYKTGPGPETNWFIQVLLPQEDGGTFGEIDALSVSLDELPPEYVPV